MPYKLIFIENPYDKNSNEIRSQLETAKNSGLIQEELHIIQFDQIQGLPIQAAPCMFLLGTDDLLNEFTGDNVLDILNFMKRKIETEQAVADMALLLKEGGIL